MRFIARQATLEDWGPLVSCWNDLKGGRHAWKITGGLPVLRSYFHLMGVQPGIFIPLLVDELGICVQGFAVIEECIQPSISPNGLGMVNCLHGFIRALYVRSGTPPEESQKLDGLMTGWSKMRKHEFLCGNCRKDFPERFAAKYGYEISHVVVKKIHSEVR